MTKLKISSGGMANLRLPKPSRSGRPGCEPTLTSYFLASLTILAMMLKSPAWNPHAMLATSINGISSSSGPIFHFPKPSPMSQTISYLSMYLLFTSGDPERASEHQKEKDKEDSQTYTVVSFAFHHGVFFLFFGEDNLCEVFPTQNVRQALLFVEFRVVDLFDLGLPFIPVEVCWLQVGEQRHKHDWDKDGGCVTSSQSPIKRAAGDKCKGREFLPEKRADHRNNADIDNNTGGSGDERHVEVGLAKSNSQSNSHGTENNDTQVRDQDKSFAVCFWIDVRLVNVVREQ
ncbi:hypothetical protein OGATHE_000738 [Ogataea polymorpha]|uniref:Uncharacterized protein n=1 Tax=Ogataea polymorpha TaxID=460523 RepID=A0A9P8PTJ1_9ASCO|nr:hypothetical protein OGATHE_000738 [Ogataea polymorpha]